MTCHDDIPNNLPQFEGIKVFTEDFDYNPEYWTLLEKECGLAPEGVD